MKPNTLIYKRKLVELLERDAILASQRSSSIKVLPRTCLIGSIKKRAAMNSCLSCDCFSVCLTNFLGICSLVFFEILNTSRNLEREKSDTSWFSRKFLVCPKIWKKSPKWSFLTFHNFLALLFGWSNLKWKTLQFSVFLYRPPIWENFGP